MHALMKVPAERFLGSSLLRILTRRARRGGRLILAYHGIVPDGAAAAGERALFVAQRDFCRQLDLITREADIVPLAEIDAIDAIGAGRPRVAVTFDDAYRGAVVQGVEELVRRGMPATFFVAPGRLNDEVFWWDALAHASGALDPSVRRHALEALAGEDQRILAWAHANGQLPNDALPAHARSASLAELRSAVAQPGISVGSHSWSHANLAALTVDGITRELRQADEWLRREFAERAIPWLAYPYGRDSAEVRRVAAALGYVGALQISGGWHRAEARAPLARPRMNVSAGISTAGFAARLNGLART